MTSGLFDGLSWFTLLFKFIYVPTPDYDGLSGPCVHLTFYSHCLFLFLTLLVLLFLSEGKSGGGVVTDGGGRGVVSPYTGKEEQ